MTFFEGARGPAAQVDELLDAEVALAAQLAGDAQPRRARRALIAHALVALPVAPQEGIDVPLAKALHGLGQLALERQAAHLAVGEHVEAGVVLQGHGPIHGAVFGGLELGGREAASGIGFAGREQLRWAEQAADDVSAGNAHGGDLTTKSRGHEGFTKDKVWGMNASWRFEPS